MEILTVPCHLCNGAQTTYQFDDEGDLKLGPCPGCNGTGEVGIFNVFGTDETDRYMDKKE